MLHTNSYRTYLKMVLYLFSQNTPPPRALNDSGCPLGDTDLFDTGLNDDEEEEESLEAIRASVKQKMKKHKVKKAVIVTVAYSPVALHSFNDCT